MKYVQVELPQNVSVDFPLAGVGERILAFIIDMVCLSIAIGICSLIIGSISSTEEWIYFVLIPSMAYTLIWEYFSNGYTLGKMLLGIRVVRLDNRRLSFPDTFSRWVFRLVDIYLCSGVLAVILVSGSPFSQRLGGVLSNTYVVKSKSNRQISLSQILRISTKKTHEVKYPNALAIRESDMVLIKKVLDRLAQKNNDASRETLSMLAEKAATVLGVDPKEIQSPVGFLRDVLKDYIVLTR